MGQAQGVVRMSEGIECHCACGEGPIPARFSHGRQAGKLEGEARVFLSSWPPVTTSGSTGPLSGSSSATSLCPSSPR